MLDPLPRRYTVCSHLFLPRHHRPSPENHGSASRVCPATYDFSQVAFRGCRYFVMFRPPSLLAPQIVPTAANTPAGQPGLLRPGTSCFVTSTRSGYANRPNTSNWRYGDLHPVRFLALSAAPFPSCYISFPSPGFILTLLTFHTNAWLCFAPPTCRMPLGQYHAIPRADLEGRVSPRF